MKHPLHYEAFISTLLLLLFITKEFFKVSATHLRLPYVYILHPFVYKVNTFIHIYSCFIYSIFFRFYSAFLLFVYESFFFVLNQQKKDSTAAPSLNVLLFFYQETERRWNIPSTMRRSSPLFSIIIYLKDQGIWKKKNHLPYTYILHYTLYNVNTFIHKISYTM